MPHHVDIHVGARVRSLRAVRRVSQTELAEKLGISFQQVQKYENGTNRISASKLYGIAKILNAQPNHFFEGLENGELNAAETTMSLRAARVGGFFESIPGHETKDRLYNLIKALASTTASQDEE